MSEFQLNNPPTDGISAVKFGPNSSQFLLASSWDNSVRLYDVTANLMKQSYTHTMAVLDCCFGDELNRVFSGGLDKTLKYYDLNSQKEQIVGSHDDAIRCVHYSSNKNVVITGGWDSKVKLWDQRMPNLVATFDQQHKVYTLDTSDDKLVVGTADRRILIWDLRSMSKTPENSRESSLKFQTRCIRCFPNKQGFVLSSIEGRAAVEYFDMNPEVQRKKYAFKCHRSRDNNVENIYPVNAIAFHNTYNTFATGGSDGMVNIWDGFNKKRLCQFHAYPTSISSLSFSHNGNLLAIASSYNYERGQLFQEQQIKDEIFIRRVSDLETKPK